MDMNEILGQLQIGPNGEVTDVPMEKTIEELGDFQFSLEKDDQGIRIQNPSFVKKNCKNCYGRGAIVQLKGGRHWQPCICVVRGYVKHRQAHDAAKKKAAKLDVLVEKVKKADETVAAIVAERKAQRE